MSKRVITAVLALFLVLAASAACAQEIAGSWEVKLHGFNYFTDRTPSKVSIPETDTTMEIEQSGDRVTITFGGFAGVSAATIFKGFVGKDNFVATWWYEGYPHETKVLTGQYSSESDRIKGRMLYPRAADKAGMVPGWVEVNFVAKRKMLVILPQPVQPVQPIQPAQPVLPVKPAIPIIPGALQVLLKEDCISFNPSTTEVKNISGRWKIVDGNHWILDFAGNRNEAEMSLKIIKHYGMDSQCFVGRPNPSMTYWRVGGQSPMGPAPGEDAIGFNPATIEVKEIGGRWKIVDGSHWILDFEGKEGEARTAYNVIKKYGFRYICFVGRPNPSMTYFRK